MLIGIEWRRNARDGGTSLVVQWLRIQLALQGHGFNLWSKIPHAPEQLLEAQAPQLESAAATEDLA